MKGSNGGGRGGKGGRAREGREDEMKRNSYKRRRIRLLYRRGKPTPTPKREKGAKHIRLPLVITRFL